MKRFVLFIISLCCIVLQSCKLKEQSDNQIKTSQDDSDYRITRNADLKLAMEEEGCKNISLMANVDSTMAFFTCIKDSCPLLVFFDTVKFPKGSVWRYQTDEDYKFFPQSLTLWKDSISDEQRDLLFYAKNEENKKMIIVFTIYNRQQKYQLGMYTLNGCIVNSNLSPYEELNQYVWANQIELTLDNIPMYASGYFQGSTFIPYELTSLSGDHYTYCRELTDENACKLAVEQIRKRILLDKISEKINTIWNDIPSIDYFISDGAQNAMRFNDKYRGRQIFFCGTIDDIDEPWGTSYKYRVTINKKCRVLTNNRDVLALNKGEKVYMSGTVTNFDSNSYKVTVVDSQVLTKRMIEEKLLSTIKDADSLLQLDPRLVSIGDYKFRYSRFSQ